MNRTELAVLEALNIASTIHMRNREYQATAAQIAEVLATDERLAEYNLDLTVGQVGLVLRGLANSGSVLTRDEPLVARVGTRRWKLTDKACWVMLA